MKLKQGIEKVRCMETNLKQGLILNKRCESWCIGSDIRMSRAGVKIIYLQLEDFQKFYFNFYPEEQNSIKEEMQTVIKYFLSVLLERRRYLFCYVWLKE